MLEPFKNDFWAISRENRGYYTWAEANRHELYRTLRRKVSRCPMCDELYDARSLVQSLFDDGIALHPLIDVTFEAFARAEVRLGLQFVPQMSNEERLTGHLISEIEAAIHLASPIFEAVSQERYSTLQQLDFAYYDLSKGGHYEKETGGDFGLIVSVDLPDRPKLIRFAAIQAKKLRHNTSLQKEQYDTLIKNYNEGAFYAFYDMNLDSLAPPLVIHAANLMNKRHEKDDTESFSLDKSYVFRNGVPLSLWLVTQLGLGKAGIEACSFSQAIREIDKPMYENEFGKNPFSEKDYYPAVSRLAMVSIGKPFSIERDTERGLTISLKNG